MKFWKKAAALLTTACMAASMLICSASAAEPAVPAAPKEPVYYVIQYSAGGHASFSGGAEGALSAYGETASKGSCLYLKVRAGSAYPSLEDYVSPDSGYFYRGGLTSGTANGDVQMTADQGVLKGSGVNFTVKYVDADTGVELAPSIQAVAPAGTSVTYSAKPVENYAPDAASKAIQAAEGGELVFTYTSTLTPGSPVEPEVIVEPGEEIIHTTVIEETVTNYVTVPGDNGGGNNAGGNNGAGNNAADNNAGAGENIPDGNVPQTDPQQGEPEQGETIEDGNTPQTDPGQAGADDRQGEAEPGEPEQGESIENDPTPEAEPNAPAEGGGTRVFIFVGGAAVLVLAMVIVYLRKKKN